CSSALETEFSVQAYVSGSVDDGLQFIEKEKSDVYYAFTTKPSGFLSHKSRDVYVTEDAPFPPIIPALYSLYHDFVKDLKKAT
ncbi:11009_t:CDS:2, partial [Acaulospora morrowiae]